MEKLLEKTQLKSFQSPDEVRQFPKGRLELVKFGEAVVGRAVFQPGWKWSTSVQPLVKTRSCEAPHFQYHVSGTSGHDAWVVGDEPAVIVDFQGMIDYAKKR